MFRHKARPYVGVSGVGSPEEHAFIADRFQHYQLDQLGRFALLGVKATSKPQVHERANKYGRKWYPVAEDISNVIDESQDIGRGVLQLYADQDWADDSHSLELIRTAVWRTKKWLAGAQYDRLPFMSMSDYDLAGLALNSSRYYKSRYTDCQPDPNFFRILQCTGDVMRVEEPGAVANRVAFWHQTVGIIDYMLFDASGGTGKEMDSQSLLPWLDAMRKRLPTMGLAVAGGLDGITVKKHMPNIVHDFPDVSWDAESRLHNQRLDKGGNGALNFRAVDEYLAASAEVLSS